MRGLKFGRVAAIAVLATVASAAVMPVAASAASGCVTRSEYRRVHDGDSMARVHRVLGTRGKQSSVYEGTYFSYQSREYRTCNSRWGFVVVGFDREYGSWRLSSKYAYWG